MRKLQYPIVIMMSSFILECATDKAIIVNASSVPPVEKTVPRIDRNPAEGSYFSEGFVSDDLAVTLYSQASDVTANPVAGARVRLALILLQENYEMTRDNLSLAEKVASSNLFAALGQEHTKITTEGARVRVVLTRSGKDLKRNWLSLLGALERQFPELVKIRTNRNRAIIWPAADLMLARGPAVKE